MAISITGSKAVHRAGSLNPLKRFVKGEVPLPVYTAVGNSGTITWDDGGKGGQFQVISETEAYYIPYNGTQIVTITATDDDGTDSATLTVFGTFPLYPQKGYEIEYNDETKVKEAFDGTEYFANRKKPTISWKISMDRRLADEAHEVWNFLLFHGQMKLFWMYDQEWKVMNKVRRKSPLPNKYEGANSWTQSLICKGRYVPTSLEDLYPLHLKLNSGGQTANGWTTDQPYVIGGTAYFFGSIVPDNSGVGDPAPDSVYYTCRVGTQYRFPNLKPVQSYQIRLHFCSDGARGATGVYNGVTDPTVLTLPGAFETVIYEETKLSDINGVLTISFNLVSGPNTLISALELIED